MESVRARAGLRHAADPGSGMASAAAVERVGGADDRRVDDEELASIRGVEVQGQPVPQRHPRVRHPANRSLPAQDRQASELPDAETDHGHFRPPPPFSLQPLFPPPSSHLPLLLTLVQAILLAALVHDLGHDGLNNNYHKNSISHRALMYNDQSVQENYHLFLLFSGMDAQPEVDIFHNLSQEGFLELRKSIIDMVLFTDMSKHFMLLKDLKETCEADSLDDKLRAASELLMKAVLHVSDISNPAKPRELAISWTERCIEEFFLQGDQEKSLGLPISPQCNRDTTSIPDSQIGFIEFVVLPSFQVLSSALPVIKDVCLPHLQSNLLYWKEKKEELHASSRKNSE
mmetsp:Transcript_3422/g.8314  ORF Transcript_3422/g.8314 Transcript_3422/m.8314 type:complete len:344 (+) Transcript_3422:1682-2713(+)